jgi:hypothetical protein
MTRMSKWIILFIVFAYLNAGSAFACAFDVDCEPGSKCLKASGAIYGVCVGGLFPGNKYDNEPVHAPLDLNRTYGNTCEFDVDCGPGSRCVKGIASIYGTCLRR